MAVWIGRRDLIAMAALPLTRAVGLAQDDVMERVAVVMTPGPYFTALYPRRSG
jgi:hypothetical protein